MKTLKQFITEEERFGLKVFPKDAVIKKVKSGDWEAITDIEVGKNVEIKDNRNGKKFQIYIKESVKEEQVNEIQDISLRLSQLKPGPISGEKIDRLFTRLQQIQSINRDKHLGQILDMDFDSYDSDDKIAYNKFIDALENMTDELDDSLNESITSFESFMNENENQPPFTQTQLDSLKSNYAGIDRVDPASKSYTSLIASLNTMPQHLLLQLAKADIKFVSKLAKNRLMNSSESTTIKESNKTITIGQIYYCVWGYSMTLANFFQVISIKGDKSVILRELKRNNIDNDRVMPIKDTFEERSQFYKEGKNFVVGRADADGKITVSRDMPCRWLRVWDGKAVSENRYD